MQSVHEMLGAPQTEDEIPAAIDRLLAELDTERQAVLLRDLLDRDARSRLRAWRSRRGSGFAVTERGSRSAPMLRAPSSRWEVVAEKSHDATQWPVVTPGGRLVMLADLKHEDLVALADQYEGDAEAAHGLAKKMRRLADELAAAEADRVADLEPAIVAELLEGLT